jgi:beta-lactamase regulating signal transducer with metallopeptidase domain
MITIELLAEWALRSSILILGGALLLCIFRPRDAALRLAAWVAMLCGSMAIPLLTTAVPALPVTAPLPQHAATVVYDPAPTVVRNEAIVARPIDWRRAALLSYMLVAGAMLLRLAAGMAMGAMLLRRSRATRRATDGIAIRESERISAPVTLGIVRSAIVLPVDWREWDSAKLDAVLAHERSHVRRRDPAVQLLSAVHRALLWHSPLSWFLHRRIVRVAEEASDDAAVAAASDRAGYAAILLDFMRRGVRGPAGHGVAMARYGCPEERIHRILNDTAIARGITLRGVAAILVLGSPLAYVVAAARPQQPPTPPQAPAAPQAAAAPRSSGAIRRYLIVRGDNSSSGSWDSTDPADREDLRARFGRHFAWFRKDGNEYAITDSGVLTELDKAMEPQDRVNRMQEEVNGQQARVNAMQGDLNGLQNEVNSLQHEVNRRQDLVNQIQGAVNSGSDEALIEKLQAAVRELQASKSKADQQSVNRRQAEVNAKQAQVNAEQAKVNAMQHNVNEEQHRVSAEFNRRIQEIFDSALRRGLAQRLM